jgi:hypothetical protein
VKQARLFSQPPVRVRDLVHARLLGLELRQQERDRKRARRKRGMSAYTTLGRDRRTPALISEFQSLNNRSCGVMIMAEAVGASTFVSNQPANALSLLLFLPVTYRPAPQPVSE